MPQSTVLYVLQPSCMHILYALTAGINKTLWMCQWGEWWVVAWLKTFANSSSSDVDAKVKIHSYIYSPASSCISAIPEVVTYSGQWDIYLRPCACVHYAGTLMSILYFIQFVLHLGSVTKQVKDKRCSRRLILFSSHLFVKLLGPGRWVSLAFCW